MNKFLIIQTAFLGDVILTLPLVQALKQAEPDSEIDFIAIPQTADIVKNHPGISKVIIYDKHGKQRSILSFLRFRNRLCATDYDVVLCPHRSLRSGLLTKATQAKTRIGFDNSALKSAFTEVVPWKFGGHEVERNLSLLHPVSIDSFQPTVISHNPPKIFISEEHRSKAERFLSEHRVKQPYAVVAPGTVWKTKRYPVEMMVEVVRKLSGRFESIIIIGGEKDLDLVSEFNMSDEKIVLAISSLPVMSSAEIIKRASLLVANDSAPIHIASAFDVPTVAIFGPTVKDFGFYPYHKKSAVVEVEGIGCRPCSIHGGRRCPIVTFDCMRKISPDEIVEQGLKLLSST
jgi:lipopolysaccharide heptosyltransferase II